MKQWMWIILVFFIVQVSEAQIKFGFTVGPSISLMTAGGESSSETFFTAGAYMDLRISRYFSIQPNVMYSRKGGQAEINKNVIAFIGYINKEAEFKLDYLDVPVYLVFSRNISKVISLQAFAGPYIGFALKTDIQEIDFLNESKRIPAPIEAKNTDFGVSFGASLKIEISKGTLIFGVRTSNGFTKIFDQEHYADYRNMITAMTLSYEYGL